MWFSIWEGVGLTLELQLILIPSAPRWAAAEASKSPQGSEETRGLGLAQGRQESDWMQLT